MPEAADSALRSRLSTRDLLIPEVSRDMDNPAWEQAHARILILRLSPFADVEVSTSHLILFAECRAALPAAYIDFAFFPNARDRTIISHYVRDGSHYVRDGSRPRRPWFFGLESGRGPEDFDLVLVSNAFALELVNLGYLFSATGMPSRASTRARSPNAEKEGAEWPIVLLGGSNAACAGSLLIPGAGSEESSDALVDGIFFGEGEFAIGEIARAAGPTRGPGGGTRDERLAALESVGGLWLARSGRATTRRIERPYPPRPPRYPILNSSGAATARLQISSGCLGFCSFCLEGWESRPYRENPLEEIVKAARELKAASGASCLEVYSYNFNAHSRVFDLIFELGRIFRRVNYMSQRLDVLAGAPQLVRAELAADKRSFTLGIEGVSERMRRYYGKGVVEGDIEACLAALNHPAVREVKLFFILSGLEDESDLEEFRGLLSKAASRRDGGGRQRILVSAGYLVRLPFTPLQYAPLCLDRAKLESLSKRMAAACEAAGVEYRLASDYGEYLADQILALGGAALSAWLEAAPSAGFLYDGALSRGASAALERFASTAGLGSSFEAEKGESWRPPLAFSDENHGALRGAYERARGLSREAARMRGPEPPSGRAIERIEALAAAKRALGEIYIRLELPRELSRAAPEYRSAWIMRSLAAAGCSSVFDAEDALFSKGCPLESLAERYWGVSIYRLLGPDLASLRRGAAAAGFEPIEASPAIERVEARLEFLEGFDDRRGDRLIQAVKEYLESESVAFVELHRGGELSLECAARDLKKRLFFSARLAEGRVELSLGPKARLGEMLARTGEGTGPALEIVSLS